MFCSLCVSHSVCKAFRALGFEAYSCDLQECSGGKPEWHIQGDAVKEAYSGKYGMTVDKTETMHSGLCIMKNTIRIKVSVIELLTTIRWSNCYRPMRVEKQFPPDNAD